MNMRLILFSILIIFVGLLAVFIFRNQSDIAMDFSATPTTIPTTTITPTPTIIINQPPQAKIIPQKTQVFQSFNNCGPASLSMLLSYFNTHVSQAEIGNQLRPYQNALGDNDDKSVTLPELARYAETYDFITYHRPNGDIELAKKLIANDLPFIVRTWLNPNEDIGHYRIVRGYDDTTQEFIQDDSYQGGNLRYSYSEFMSMWQPFNYEYLVIIPAEKQELVKAILQEDTSWEYSWHRALEKAQQESQQGSQNPYPVFNQSVAYYHLGNYEASVQKYEEVVSRLPSRMLWYQIEPIASYLEIGDYERVFNLTGNILNNQNRGYSELYILRGKAYEKQNNIELARQEYQQAIFYNQYLPVAQEAVQSLNNTANQ